ncbi:alginate export family protein [Aequorivita viscosa]|uniref:Alginate export n=1 Tax=Aequorivita viscosa TaxID=797419 RepID=A0A1M6GXH2_9FLAO|nr:alginate export family protein [Aequorivita viscosa]SDW79642.1 Alginate export [Aequorivita viscosa]SHJ14631.1 Alginate export [Aequorivita viscosa]
MSKLKSLLPLLLLFFLEPVFAQFTIDASLRPRFEYRHGYKTLFPNNIDPATFVSQRTRLNFSYKTEKLHFYLSPQDVRVWGDVPQLNVADENGVSLHQAWANVLLVQNLSLKLGRQEIVYDDQRLFGNVDWAQQGRSHDAAILKFEPNNTKIHFGAAYNQDREALTGNTLTKKTYKSLQYVWLHKNINKVSASFLFLNNGLQYIDEIDESKNETRYSQTAGVHIDGALNKFKFSSNLYYQFGKDIANNSLEAYLISLEAAFKPTKNLNLGLGGELISGNEYGAPKDGKNNAFNPLYGTNHKFNGFMDYFYVGNHIDDVGLLDLHGKVSYAFNTKSNVIVNFHKFFAASKIDSDLSKDLGFELDLVTSYSITQFVGVKAGYSHYFTSEGIESVKNNYDGNSNNWAWIMISIDPVLFTWSENKTTNK